MKVNSYSPALIRHLARRQRFSTSLNLRYASAAASVAPVSSKRQPTLDSLPLINSELSNLKSSLFHLLGSSHPSLDAVAKYYFQAEGKHLRPMLVLLLSQATNGLGGAAWESILEKEQAAEREGRGVDESLTSVEGVLNDWNPEQMGMEGEADMTFAEPYDALLDRTKQAGSSSNTTTTTTASKPSISKRLDPGFEIPGTIPILSTQRRLASITEMIHVASLLHDDVIDTSPLRRGLPSAPQQFSNKLSILAGDFLLGRASVALARLGSNEVVELLATVIANLVEGEVMQLGAASGSGSNTRAPSQEAFEIYMRKTYLKTASLMAKSARASVILGGAGQGYGQTTKQVLEGERLKDIAYGYGRNLGIAFQLIDDMLDFLPPSPELGKPGLGADLSLGLTTAPSLFAWQANPSLGPLIARKFSESGDVEQAREIVTKSDGLRKTRELAERFASEARRGVERLPESEAREALVRLTKKVVERVS